MKIFAAIVLLLHGGVALACGHCVEDRIATVYDHAMIEAAFAQHRHVAFFAIDGELHANSAQRQVFDRALRKIPGVDARSLLFSMDTASLSFSFDPARVTVEQIGASLQRQFALQNLTPHLLRVMTHTGEFESESVASQHESAHHD